MQGQSAVGAAAPQSAARPCQYRDYRQSPQPLNQYEIADYSLYTMEQLALPWSIPNHIVNSSYDHARECTVIFKGLPDEFNTADVLPPMLTLNGSLPHFNHEVVAASVPVNYHDHHRGVAFVRYSNPRFANSAVRMFNNSMVHGRRIQAMISDHPCKVDSAKVNAGVVKGGVYLYHNAWRLINESIIHGEKELHIEV